jgi:hypothetical protein
MSRVSHSGSGCSDLRPPPRARFLAGSAFCSGFSFRVLLRLLLRLLGLRLGLRHLLLLDHDLLLLDHDFALRRQQSLLDTN